MAVPQKPASPPPIAGGDVAPFVYFDGAYASALVDGQMIVELAARTFVPVGLRPNDPLRMRPVATAHLRGSMMSFRQLAEAISKALAAAEPPQKQGELTHDDDAT